LTRFAALGCEGKHREYSLEALFGDAGSRRESTMGASATNAEGDGEGSFLSASRCVPTLA
jgi:hypothetical protein